MNSDTGKFWVAGALQLLWLIVTSLLQFLRARTMIGRRSFAVAGPSLWNSLPAALRRQEMTLHTLLSDNSRPICSTSDVLSHRRNIHHRPTLLWHCLWVWCQIPNCQLSYLSDTTMQECGSSVSHLALGLWLKFFSDLWLYCVSYPNPETLLPVTLLTDWLIE